jgi:hypothetical protein
VSACVCNVERDTKLTSEKMKKIRMLTRLCESDVKICDHFERLHNLWHVDCRSRRRGDDDHEGIDAKMCTEQV